MAGRAHSGETIGILRSVNDDGDDHPSVVAVLRCLAVDSAPTYTSLVRQFATENEITQRDEQVDLDERRFLPDSWDIIDPFSMVVVRLRDDQGNSIGDFDFRITGVPVNPKGKPRASPDLLPKDFLQDRQRNKRDAGTLTFYLNEALMAGCRPVVHPTTNKTLREGADGLQALGFIVEPHLATGFVHFVKAESEADSLTLQRVLKPNQTTMIEIVMKRVVREGVMRLQRLDKRDDRKFDKTPPGDPID